jgi:hypothetical protein
MPLTIIHKHSDATTAGVADPPLATDLASGELGVNFSADDPALYIVDNANNVRKIQGTPNRKFTLQNDDVNLVGGDTTTAINAALTTGAIIPSVASLLISDQVEVQDSGNPDANTNVTVGRYFYDGAIWFSSGSGGASVTVGDTAPASPAAGDLWWDSSEASGSNGGRLYLWYEDGDSNQWVQTSNVGGGGGSSVSVGDTPPATPTAGDLWWDSSDTGGRLWVWYVDANSSQWVEASPNQAGSSFWIRDDATTTVSPSAAGDDVFTSGDMKVGGTTAAPNIDLKADGSASFATGKYTIASDNAGMVYSRDSASILFVRNDGATDPSGIDIRIPNGLTAPGAADKFYIRGGKVSAVGSQDFYIGTDGSASFGGASAGRMLNVRKQNTAAFFGQPADGAAADMVTIQCGTNAGDTSTRYINFRRQDGSIIGYVGMNGANAITFSTNVSDYRLKENVVPLPNSIGRLKALRPVRFNFIESPSEIFDGFIAHECTDIPKAVIGEKDAVDEEGKIIPQSVDVTRMIPLLTAALQEALTRIEALEAEVTALKGGTTN